MADPHHHAGGAVHAGRRVDISARLQAQAIGDILGQNVIVENIGGGGGMTAGSRVAHAAPDGYTFMIGNTGTHAYNQTLYKKPLYNSVTDFTPVGPDLRIAAHPQRPQGSPGQRPAGIHRLAQGQPAKAQFGSAGVGSGTHLPCVLFNLAIGVDVTDVPYRGRRPGDPGPARRAHRLHVRHHPDRRPDGQTGPVKPIAVLAEHRVAIIPDVPTSGEQGLPGVEASVWNAFFFPKGTPDAIVRKLNAAMNKSLENPGCASGWRNSAWTSSRRSGARRNIWQSTCPRRSPGGRSRSGRRGSVWIEGAGEEREPRRIGYDTSLLVSETTSLRRP